VDAVIADCVMKENGVTPPTFDAGHVAPFMTAGLDVVVAGAGPTRPA
jgi:hypothetical protein